MNVRQPFRAGSFYKASPQACRAETTDLLAGVRLPDDLPGRLVGGIVPHAGWRYSGSLAAVTFKALAQVVESPTVVLLGADHCGTARAGEVYDRGAWAGPLGEVEIDEPLAEALLAGSDLLGANPSAHAREHSLEVQVPFIQVLWPGVKIVPVLVAPSTDAVAIGDAIGQVAARQDWPVVIVGSTDLTHHGGHFPSPGGRGRAGVDWTVANDRRMIDLMEQMAAERVVPESAQRQNACGAGAVAATIAACRALGATAGRCLEYDNSYEVTHRLFPNQADDTTVGYASVVFA